MSAPVLSAGLIKATTLQISGAQAGAIQATNLDFDNLNVGGNIVKGSRKVAESPFHFPTPRGQYAVDLHNVVSWLQTETTIIVSKSHISEALNTAYESTHAPSELVRDSVTPDSSGYDVPTKYGVKRIALEFGDCFYSAEKEAFMTPPTPISMSIFLPSTRDKTQEFNVYDSNPSINYYQQGLSGNFDFALYSGYARFFNDDVSNDSVFQLFMDYDFSVFDESDLSKDLGGEAFYPTLLTDITESKSLANTSNHARYIFIKYVLNLFYKNVNISTRVNNLLTAIKSTGAYTRIMSYKWNLKRYTQYTDTSGVLSTNISDSQVPNSLLPVHISQYIQAPQAMELASRGIVCIYYNYDYHSGPNRLPGTNELSILNGALIWSSGDARLVNDIATYNYTSPSEVFPYNHENLYDTENRFTVNDGNYTGIGSLEYNVEVLRAFYDLFVESELTNIIDVKKVSAQGASGSAWTCIAANLVMEKYPTFPMKFTCIVTVDNVSGMPWDLSVNGVHIGDYYNTPRQEVFPNGYSIPVLWMDQNHASYDKTSGTNTAVGFIGWVQRGFRKTPVEVRAECIYHEFGDMHNSSDQNPFTETNYRNQYMRYMPTTSDGLNYPDDSINNLAFNESLVSVESETIMQYIKAYVGMALFVCRHSLPYFPVSKEVIKAILPGTTTISPYTLDDAAQFLDNAVVFDSIKMPKVITMYDSNVYDFVHDIPGKSTYCFDLTDIKAINLPFLLQNVPSGIVANVGVQTVGVTYNNTSHTVNTFNGNVSTYRSYIPHADIDGFADTSGIEFVIGTNPNGSWQVAELDGSTWFRSGDVGEEGTPSDYGSVIMSITCEVTGKLEFTARSSSESGYDFLFVYKNGAKIFGESDDISGNGTIRNISIKVKKGDFIKIAYIKDRSSSFFDDVIYIKDLMLKELAYDDLSVVGDVHPACNVDISLGGGSSINQDVDLTLFNLSKIPVVTEIEGVTITLTENLVLTGKLLVTIEYFKIPPADSVINLVF